MSAFVIVDINPMDAEKLKVYAEGAGKTLQAAGGKILAKGAIHVLHGEAAFQSKAVIEFPDRDAALDWYASEEYQALVDNRDDAMDSQFHLIG